MRTGPSGDGAFDAELGGPLSALAYRRGRATPDGPVQADPARAAAARFDDVLEARGVTINGVPRAGTAPAGADAIAGVQSAPVRTLVAAMLRPSDDWIAEILTKLLAPAPGSTAAARAQVVRGRRAAGRRRSSTARASTRATAARPPRSSPSCAGCPATPPSGPRWRARAGRARSQDRLTSGRARRACRGKTGTLPSGGVSALAGYCTTRKGRRLAFAVLARDVPLRKAQQAQDRVARALAAAR